MFSSTGPVEIFVLMVIFLVLFGSKKLPEFIKGLGEAIKEFKKAVKEDK